MTINITKRFKAEHVKDARKKKKSSVKWLNRQINDPFVKEAQARGYRCRAAFKILEINDKFKLFKKGYKVLDLGSAPGGWSQVVVDIVDEGNVLATDILEMMEISGVKFLQQDFLADDATEKILEAIDGKKFDVVMSDMAANTTGNKQLDHIRTTILVESGLDFAIKVLKDGGSFVAKVFQGGTEAHVFNKLKHNFSAVKHFKPESSRKDSVEMYVVAKGFKGLKTVA